MADGGGWIDTQWTNLNKMSTTKLAGKTKQYTLLPVVIILILIILLVFFFAAFTGISILLKHSNNYVINTNSNEKKNMQKLITKQTKGPLQTI